MNQFLMRFYFAFRYFSGPQNVLCGSHGIRYPFPSYEQTTLSNDVIDSVLRHREIGRAKDLSAHPRIGAWVGTRVGLDECGNLSPTGFDPRTVQPVASRYTD